jgi:hypothetical protein
MSASNTDFPESSKVFYQHLQKKLKINSGVVYEKDKSIACSASCFTHALFFNIMR